jgi:hypothetical protein
MTSLENLITELNGACRHAALECEYWRVQGMVPLEDRYRGQSIGLALAIAIAHEHAAKAQAAEKAEAKAQAKARRTPTARGFSTLGEIKAQAKAQANAMEVAP